MEYSLDKLLRDFTACDGVSGYEEQVLRLFKAVLSPCCGMILRDVMGNLRAIRTRSASPDQAPVVLLDAHADEIGMLVRWISPDGLIYVQGVGRWDAELAVAQRVNIHTAHGLVPAVVGRKAAHLLQGSEAQNKSSMREIWLDIGASSEEEARRLVEVGDWITYEPNFHRLAGDKVVAKALDNRAGLTALCAVMHSLAEIDPDCNVCATASVQEEVGCRGIAPLAQSMRVTVALTLDTVHTSDYPGVDKRQLGDIRLGLGPVLVKGPGTHPLVYKRLTALARQFGIPYQVQASCVTDGTNAGAIQLAGGGIPCGVVGLPLRYMHSPGEMLSLLDLQAAVELITLFVGSVKSADDWIADL